MAVFACLMTVYTKLKTPSWDADQTLVMGFNHASWSPESRVISYGSCTVNAFVPLASWLHEAFVIQEAQVNVIHNVPAHRLAEHAHPERRTCTLEAMTPRLLPWLSPERFFVNYTLIPYTGASLIDFRFRLGTPVLRSALIDALRTSCTVGALQARYAVLENDPGICGTLGLPFNTLLHEDGIVVEGDTLYLSGYFDNENSAVRYLELVQWIAERLER
jgi:glyceraldehyde 3-phosphate dehydrogenase